MASPDGYVYMSSGRLSRFQHQEIVLGRELLQTVRAGLPDVLDAG
jgi:hypothetical protein